MATVAPRALPRRSPETDASSSAMDGSARCFPKREGGEDDAPPHKKVDPQGPICNGLVSILVCSSLILLSLRIFFSFVHFSFSGSFYFLIYILPVRHESLVVVSRVCVCVFVRM